MRVVLLAATAVVLLPVPFVPQPKDGCAAAALAMVMRHWGAAGDAGGIARDLREPELRGIRGSRLEEFARQRGFTALAYKGDLEHLAGSLAKGRPLIVAWGRDAGAHDVVVVGAEPGAIVVHDPALGAYRRVEASEFERRWRRAGFWTLLVLPKAP
jgi:ABC-type bacteriocin/lantibiotic exporter with double-glycine peptidase domain